MWLRVLHLLGLTNLSDEQVRLYDEQKRSPRRELIAVFSQTKYYPPYADYGYQEISTVITRDATFEGTFYVEGGMWIDGILHGKGVCTGTLTIGQDGNIEANLRARDIIIAGTIVGTIEAENRITLQSTARLEGNLKAITVVVEEGAMLKAHSDIGSHPLSSSSQYEDDSIVASDVTNGVKSTPYHR